MKRIIFLILIPELKLPFKNLKQFVRVYVTSEQISSQKQMYSFVGIVQ
jgi:hypothetical protein